MRTNWESAVYSQERKVVKITNFNANTVQVRLTIVTPVNAIAHYVVPTSRELQIDVTDIVRLANNGRFTLIGYDASGNIVTGDMALCEWITEGFINPSRDIRPRSELLEKWTEIAEAAGGDVSISLAPPSRILEQLTGIPLIVEMHGTNDVWVWVTTNMFDAETSQITIQPDIHEWEIGDDYNRVSYGIYGTTERNGCNRACAVRWISRYGVQKQLVWYYKDQRVKVSDVVSIETIDGTYDERKGYVPGLTLFLDELNAYDYWYYSDIITSPKVEIYINGFWRVVQVDTKSVQIPNNDTGKPKDLEVQINLQKYDAI